MACDNLAVVAGKVLLTTGLLIKAGQPAARALAPLIQKVLQEAVGATGRYAQVPTLNVYAYDDQVVWDRGDFRVSLNQWDEDAPPQLEVTLPYNFSRAQAERAQRDVAQLLETAAGKLMQIAVASAAVQAARGKRLEQSFKANGALSVKVRL